MNCKIPNVTRPEPHTVKMSVVEWESFLEYAQMLFSVNQTLTREIDILGEEIDDLHRDAAGEDA